MRVTGIACCYAVQAFAKLSESKVTVKVREADQGLAKEAIEAARKKYADAFSRDGPTATLDTKTFLPAGATGKEGEAENTWCAFTAMHADQLAAGCQAKQAEPVAIAFKLKLVTIFWPRSWGNYLIV